MTKPYDPWSTVNTSVPSYPNDKPYDPCDPWSTVNTSVPSYPNDTTPCNPHKPYTIPVHYNHHMGWICPKCNAVLAPWVSSCFCSNFSPIYW